MSVQLAGLIIPTPLANLAEFSCQNDTEPQKHPTVQTLITLFCQAPLSIARPGARRTIKCDILLDHRELGNVRVLCTRKRGGKSSSREIVGCRNK